MNDTPEHETNSTTPEASISSELLGLNPRIRITKITVSPENEPLFSEMNSHIEIKDDAAGEYVSLKQQSGSPEVEEQTVEICPKEWPNIKEAIDFMINECRA